MKDLYKCDDHKIDLVCMGCVNAWIARHDKMLDFVKIISNEAKSILPGEFYAKLARDILKEIGK